MNKVKKWTLGIAAATFLLAALIVGGYAYGGGFQKLRVETTELPAQAVAGLAYTGPYETMFASFEKANRLLDSLQIPAGPGIGWYFDDPSTVDPKQCRGLYGRALTASLDPTQQASLRAAGLQTDTLPAGKALVVHFEAKNSLSYMIGALRAYPLLTEATQTGRHGIPTAVFSSTTAPPPPTPSYFLPKPPSHEPMHPPRRLGHRPGLWHPNGPSRPSG